MSNMRHNNLALFLCLCIFYASLSLQSKIEILSMFNVELNLLLFLVFVWSWLQPPVHPVDEYGALIYAGRWGNHGVSLPGRVTFAPGYVGFSTFGAPRPLEVCHCT